MANLYSDSNMYITDVTETSGNPHIYTVSWNYTSNNANREFTVRANSLITDITSTGKALFIGQNTNPRDRYVENNAFTTVNISPKSTSNSGSGLVLQLAVGTDGYANYTVVSQGAGYNLGDYVVFDKDDTHRSELTVGSDVDVWLRVDQDDKAGLNYFPPGLADADVVANAVPLMNLEYGF